ncbi:hypothetical protein S40293_06181 [Stachybotrys chartarum IBT 40293]|nr:hypothetical protein S40293_06181 [Stachybotrys chartarum IBT 40293]
MPSPSGKLLALVAMASSAEAAYRGFNYGSTFTDGAAKVQANFEAEFRAAANLDGADGAFTSARLFTMIQAGTANDPISAIPAAINTRTSLLFGLWASAGDDAFGNELAALQRTIDQYCSQLDGLVAGISVGSEDLYRISPTAIANNEYAGASPDKLVGYIARVRDTIRGSCLTDIPIGHVDTWTAYVNGSNSAVIDAIDWLGMDAYPYFEDTKPNSLQNGRSLFASALDQTRAVANGKQVWVTETGWPVSGDMFGQAVPSTDNARTYYQQVGCSLFGTTNTWWFTFQDSSPTTPNPSFGLIGSDLTTTPLFDVSCDGVSSTPFSSIRARDADDDSGSSSGDGVDASPVPDSIPNETVRSGKLNALGAAVFAIALAIAMA